MKHSVARQNIIETASRLFYQKGYSLTGINEIIKEANVAKATLYNHFKSKDDICIAYLNHRNQGFLEDFKGFLLKSPKGKAQILAMFDFLKAFYATSTFNGCWCINTISEIPPENVTIRETIQNQKRNFLKLIEVFTKANFPNQTIIENEILAKRIYLLYEGALAECHIHQQSWPIDSAKELCEYILK
jgi:AcrR family transcriptional regulator